MEIGPRVHGAYFQTWSLWVGGASAVFMQQNGYKQAGAETGTVTGAVFAVRRSVCPEVYEKPIFL